MCPGFAVDCLETLEEIALQEQAKFRGQGGEALRYIPCLNASDAHADALASLARRELDVGGVTVVADHLDHVRRVVEHVLDAGVVMPVFRQRFGAGRSRGHGQGDEPPGMSSHGQLPVATVTGSSR